MNGPLSAKQFEAILSAVGEAIIVLDANGGLVFSNREAEIIWGY